MTSEQSALYICTEYKKCQVSGDYCRAARPHSLGHCFSDDTTDCAWTSAQCGAAGKMCRCRPLNEEELVHFIAARLEGREGT